MAVPKKPSLEGDRIRRAVVDFHKLIERTMGDSFPNSDVCRSACKELRQLFSPYRDLMDCMQCDLTEYSLCSTSDLTFGLNFLTSQRECDRKFLSNKLAIISSSTLCYVDFLSQFTLITDANSEMVGAVLSLGSIDKNQPLAYTSRTLNKAERNYSGTEMKILVIVWAVKNFRCHLQDEIFSLYRFGGILTYTN